jgi:hypothetical protein
MLTASQYRIRIPHQHQQRSYTSVLHHQHHRLRDQLLVCDRLGPVLGRSYGQWTIVERKVERDRRKAFFLFLLYFFYIFCLLHAKFLCLFFSRNRVCATGDLTSTLEEIYYEIPNISNTFKLFLQDSLHIILQILLYTATPARPLDRSRVPVPWPIF